MKGRHHGKNGKLRLLPEEAKDLSRRRARERKWCPICGERYCERLHDVDIIDVRQPRPLPVRPLPTLEPNESPFDLYGSISQIICGECKLRLGYAGPRDKPMCSGCATVRAQYRGKLS